MESIGKSVGAIIRDGDGRYLVQYRLKHPVGLAMPAGHINEGESPEAALRREILEETGLRVERAELCFHDSFRTPCAKNHNGHEWWVYNVEVSGTPERKEPTKHEFLKFMSVDEMRPYIERRVYDPAWFEHILPALNQL